MLVSEAELEQSNLSHLTYNFLFNLDLPDLLSLDN